MAGKFEIKISTNGKPFFNLKAGNGQIILSSEIYESKDRKSTRLNSSHLRLSRMPSSA